MLWSDCTQTSDGKVCITGAKGRYGCAGVVKTISLPQTGILILEILNIQKNIISIFLPELCEEEEIPHAPGHHPDVVVRHELHRALIPVNGGLWEA